MNGSSKGIKLLVAIGILLVARVAIAQEPAEVKVAPPDLESSALEDAAVGGLELSQPQERRSRYWNRLTTDQRRTVRTRSRQRLIQQRAFRQQRLNRSRGDASRRVRPRLHRPNRPTDRALDTVRDR